MKKLLLTLMVTLAALGVKAADPADVQVLLDTDFTVFTDGTEENPTKLYSSDVTNKISGYYLASEAYSAGGKLLIKQNGSLTMNYLEGMPTSGGTVRITARIYMIEYNGGIQYQPGYSPSDYAQDYIEADKWLDVVTLVSNVRSTSRIKICPWLSINGFYIESLKVEYSADFIAPPVAYLPTDANGESFTASCSVTSGDVKYEADVFSYDAQGNVVYFQQDVELKKLTAYSTSATAKITGLDPKTTYWYVARCVNASGAKSDNSEPVKVIKNISDVDAPVATDATDITTKGFTANWQPVDDASSYMINVFSKELLTEDKSVEVFGEDFSGVTVGTPSSLEYGGDLNDYTKVKGWVTDMSKTFAAGYYVIYPINASGTLVTPPINLSGSEGKFRVVITAATRSYAGFESSDDTLTVELMSPYHTEPIETATVAKLDQSDFADYSFDFTKGIEGASLRITFTRADGSTMKLFIDDIKIYQTLSAGEIYEKQIASVGTKGTLSGNTLSHAVEIDLDADTDYYYKVVAIAETVVGSGATASVGTIESDSSNAVEFKLKTNSVENMLETSASAWKESGNILKVAGRNVVVADLSGRVLLQNISETVQEYALSCSGVVIAVVDGKSYKFIF